MRTLVVTEKPNVAERIANSLGKAVKKTHGGVSYYQVGDTIVAPAVGHIFGLRERNYGGWVYPVFDIEWAASHTINKSSAFTKKYLDNIKALGRDCDRFINACDYDVEGEVIGYNVIKYACSTDPHSKKVARVKYSTLTRESILKAFENMGPIDYGMADAGLTRHVLDWYWGINLSRALSNAARSARKYVTLSIGRVQGPTLKILAVRERSIRAFKPQKYWQVEMLCVKGQEFSALHDTEKFDSGGKAEEVRDRCGPKAQVAGVVSKKYRQAPPHPFDLTTLQTEAYKHLHIDPRRTLELAQNLYTNAYISYPRTSSQQIPADIDCKKIIKDLRRQDKYDALCGSLLAKKKLKPANGKKTDPAHPAIHPTGELPSKLDAQHAKVYDLIVRRFLATFGEHAVRRSVTVKLKNNGEPFTSKGNTTVEKGWHVFYGPYAKFEENELPPLAKGEEVAVKDVVVHEKETKPPKRYTPASIIREMEKRNIGTKATRSQIVDILFRRGYVDGKAIEVTNLGLSVVDALGKYCPEVLSDKLTRKFEGEMEKIQDGKLTSEEVVEDGRKTLSTILSEFKVNEGKIGEALAEGVADARRKHSSLGPCPSCGSHLVVRTSRYGGHFIGCSNYPDCTHTWPLPKDPVSKTATCKHCGYAVMTCSPKGRRKWRFCVNQACPGKKKK